MTNQPWGDGSLPPGCYLLRTDSLGGFLKESSDGKPFINGPKINGHETRSYLSSRESRRSFRTRSSVWQWGQ